MANINKSFGEDYNLSANIGGSLSNTSYNSLGYGGPLSDVPNGFNVYNIDRNNGSPALVAGENVLLLYSVALK